MQFTATEAGEYTPDVDDHGNGRRLRWKRRTRARQIAYHHEPGRPSTSTSPLKRLKSCGLAKAPDVIIKVHNHHAFATGLMACGNIWTCPTCSARIRARREVEIETALANHCQGGANIGMMTLTLRHNLHTPLRDTIEQLNDAWAKLQRFHTYKPIYNALVGTIATLEITYGDHGWHPHLHILMLAGTDTTQLQLRDATDRLRVAWSQLVNTKTDKYSIEHGLNLLWFGRDSATAAKYVTKLAKEITLTDTKSGTDPFALLDRDDPQSYELYLEYAFATYRRQCHRWSNGLRAALNMSKELSDEELAECNDDPGVEVLVITRQWWNTCTETERLGFLELCEALHFINGP